MKPRCPKCDRSDKISNLFHWRRNWWTCSVCNVRFKWNGVHYLKHPADFRQNWNLLSASTTSWPEFKRNYLTGVFD